MKAALCYPSTDTKTVDSNATLKIQNLPLCAGAPNLKLHVKSKIHLQNYFRNKSFITSCMVLLQTILMRLDFPKCC